MNKKGQSFGLTLISVIFFLIIAFASVNFIFDQTSTTVSQLNCDSAETISDGTMLLCLITDSTVIYMIVSIISVILGVLTAQLLTR